MARWTSCNVLQSAPEKRRLWTFGIGSQSVHLIREEQKLPNEALPAKVVAKDWQALYKPRLNVAWIPADEVFLRVLQLPRASAAETVSMIELQLEKVSPMPVAQIVWSYEPLRSPADQPQTIVLIVVARSYVEQHVTLLEGQSYFPDRLEVPFLDRLLLTKPEGDGVWIYPGTGADEKSCLVAWWYQGLLQNVSLIHLPEGEGSAGLLREQISQIAWAGELEGWLTAEPRFT